MNLFYQKETDEFKGIVVKFERLTLSQPKAGVTVAIVNEGQAESLHFSQEEWDEIQVKYLEAKQEEQRQMEKHY